MIEQDQEVTDMLTDLQAQLNVEHYERWTRTTQRRAGR